MKTTDKINYCRKELKSFKSSKDIELTFFSKNLTKQEVININQASLSIEIDKILNKIKKDGFKLYLMDLMKLLISYRSYSSNNFVPYDSIIDETCDLLIEKNQSYGDSALNPINVFGRGSNIECLTVRIDDKLSRIANNPKAFGEDVIKDLLGYLILLWIAVAVWTNEGLVPTGYTGIGDGGQNTGCSGETGTKKTDESEDFDSLFIKKEQALVNSEIKRCELKESGGPWICFKYDGISSIKPGFFANATDSFKSNFIDRKGYAYKYMKDDDKWEYATEEEFSKDFQIRGEK